MAPKLWLLWLLWISLLWLTKLPLLRPKLPRLAIGCRRAVLPALYKSRILLHLLLREAVLCYIASDGRRFRFTAVRLFRRFSLLHLFRTEQAVTGRTFQHL